METKVNMKVKTLEIDNNCARLSLTGAFDDHDQTTQSGELQKVEQVNRGPPVKLMRLSSSSYPNLLIKEDHFTSPEFLEKTSKISVIEGAIEEYMTQIKTCTSRQDKSRLVKKLVELRFELLNLKDDPAVPEDGSKLLMGHMLEEKPWGRARGYCEKCCAVIIGIFQSWYKCKTCNYCCHKKCIDNITRICANSKMQKDPTIKLNICPEVGLQAQHYCCLECKAPIGFQPGTEEARQCDYTGSFYCNKCHWNDSMVIPARVIANWDFEPRKVCRSSKSFLKLMSQKAIFKIKHLNPTLFTYIEELGGINKKREDILMMKKFFLECPDALKEKLLLQLKHRQHFVENSDVYSLRDLIDVHQDVLLPELTKIHALFAQHIKSNCKTCKAKGKTCEICNSDEVLYPFDGPVHVCFSCSCVVHMHCFQVKNKKCPKCS